MQENKMGVMPIDKLIVSMSLPILRLFSNACIFIKWVII